MEILIRLIDTVQGHHIESNREHTKENMMHYMLLIYTDETRNAHATSQERESTIQDYVAFTRDIRESGHMIAGDELQPTNTAKTIQVIDEEMRMMDGPFAETKEQLGGYYIIEANDIDEAVQIAGKVPGAKHGCIEVRPISEYN